MSMTLFRASDDDIVVGTASFSETEQDARAYLNNPGFGGRNLYRADIDVDASKVFDATDMDRDEFFEALGVDDPGAIGIDEFVGRGDATDALRDKGVSWVIVRESYPSDSRTWIFIGGDEDPEMVPISQRVRLSEEASARNILTKVSRRLRG